MPHVDDIEDMGKKELQHVLKEHGLASTGKKTDLLHRLKAYILESAEGAAVHDRGIGDSPSHDSDIDDDGNIKDLIDDTQPDLDYDDDGSIEHYDEAGKLPVQVYAHHENMHENH